MLRIPLQWLAPIALLVVILLLWEKTPTGLIMPTAPEADNFPYAYMTSIETLEYDSGGKLRFKMSTPEARYFQLDTSKPSPEDYTLIEQPDIIFFSARDASPWHLRADQGRSNANGHEVVLTHNVSAEQQSSEQGLIQVTTSELHINTESQYAETDKAVKMRAQQSQIETVGMRAFMNEDRIELLSEVRGTYAP